MELFFSFFSLFFLLTSINAELDDLRDLPAHGVFCAILQIGTIFFQRVRWILVGASAVVVTVAEITLHRVYTWSQREKLNFHIFVEEFYRYCRIGDLIVLICVM